MLEWGFVIMIMIIVGFIFEVKVFFLKGKVVWGYYNLMGCDGELYGYLKFENISYVVLVSKLFMGCESYYFGFFIV